MGEKAPKIDTPTVESVGGDVKQIDTRVPPGTMHDDNFADVLGKKPILLLFATPALCQTRVCGPVVDIAEQVKARTSGDTAFIHMEIYNDNELEKGFRPQVGDLQAADRAVGVRDRPRRQGRRAARGRVLRARAERGRQGPRRRRSERSRPERDHAARASSACAPRSRSWRRPAAARAPSGSASPASGAT